MELSTTRKATSCAATQEHPAFYGTRRFINPFTRALHLSLSWTRPIQTILPRYISPRPIIKLYTHLRLGLSSGIFPSGFPINIWRRVKITKILDTQLSLPSRHFIPLRSKYLPQHPVLKHPQSMFLPLCQRTCFTPIQNHRQNYSLVYLNFGVFRQQTGRQKVLDRIVANITKI
jgi:hypothetical protein